MRQYGPYLTKESRLFVILIDGDGKRRSVSYPKFLMEQKLGKELGRDETVHHKDGDFLNNELDNLEIIARSYHAAAHARRLRPQEFVCPWCGDKYILKGKKLGEAKRNERRGMAGPFCSRVCAGKYGKAVQTNRTKRLEGRDEIGIAYHNYLGE